MADFIEKLERAAFERGRKSAFQHIARIAGNLATLDGTPATDSDTASSHGSAAPANAVGPNPRKNSDQARVLDVIRQRDGIRGVDILPVLAERGHPTGERTMRTALYRLKLRRLIEQRDGLWYPTVEKET